jgi:hypothetical protein
VREGAPTLTAYTFVHKHKIIDLRRARKATSWMARQSLLHRGGSRLLYPASLGPSLCLLTGALVGTQVRGAADVVCERRRGRGPASVAWLWWS